MQKENWKKGTKFLIAQQYWDGDRLACEENARIMADLEPSPRNDVIFMFFARWDAKPISEFTKGRVRKKFPDLRFGRGTSAVSGWPDGCNALWRDLMVRMNTEPDVEVVLASEPDCVPVVRNWINPLWAVWKLAQSLELTYVVGHHVPGGGVPEHFNGNGMFHPKMMTLEPTLKELPPKGSSWDTYFAKDVFLKHGQDTPLISSHYNNRVVEKWDLFKPGVVLDHGAKGMTVREMVKGKFGVGRWELVAA